jgi:hypothetical protein
MNETQRSQENASLEAKTLWQQLTPQQREQIAVVILRILRQLKSQSQAQEAENEPVTLGV